MSQNPEEYSKKTSDILKRIAEQMKRITERIRPDNRSLSEPVRIVPIPIGNNLHETNIAVRPAEDSGFGYNEMNFIDENLARRFYIKKLDDMLNDHILPLPTIICEMERIEMIELVRKYVLYSNKMTPFTSDKIEPQVGERLEKKKVKNYGELYILVNIN